MFDADTVNSWNAIKLVFKEFTDTFVAPFNEMYSLQSNDGSSPWCVQGKIICKKNKLEFLLLLTPTENLLHIFCYRSHPYIKNMN